MPEAKFVLKEPKAEDKTLIYLFFNFNNQRLKYSTGEKINPKYWNTKKQRAKETINFPEYPEFNQRLNSIEAAVNTTYRRLLNDKVDFITSDLLRKELDIQLNKSIDSKKAALIDWIQAEIELMKKDKKVGSIKVYNTLVNHLNNFSALNRRKLYFGNIDLEFYREFMDYLILEKKLLNNTVAKQIKTLKTFLIRAKHKGVNNNLFFENPMFKAVQEEVNHIYLSSEELDIIYNTDIGNKMYLDRVRDLFLIGCHTGLRFSDFSHLREENLEKTKNGYVFKVKTNKTSKRVVIPIKPVVKAIWDKYEGNLPRAISNQKMNEYLKELGKVAKISKTVTIKQTSGKEV